MNPERPVALVTGAARRIGAAIARRLHAGGHDLALHHLHSSDEMAALASELGQVRAGSVLVLRADLAAPDRLPELVAATVGHFGRLDALVNNASAFHPTPLDTVTPWYVTFPVAIVAAAAFGAAWAFIPAYLQARRGSHIVITTIMFNMIAASLMIYMLRDVLKPAASQDVKTRMLEAGAQLPRLNWIIEMLGSGRIRSAPFNVSFLLALAMAWLVWLLIWRTKLGYEIRTMGFSPKAARYAGISEVRITIVAMLISGALAGMMSINAIMGDQHNVYVDLAGGAGFIGIAVALMGRAHPVGIVLAAILFGMLYQGGAELAFEMPAISRDMIVIIQGLVILFAGALEHMFRPYIQALFASFSPRSVGMEAVKGKGA